MLSKSLKLVKSITRAGYKAAKYMATRTVRAVMILVLMGLTTFYGPEIHEGYIQGMVAKSVVYLTSKNAEGADLFVGTGFHATAASGKSVIVTNNHVCDSVPQIYASGNGHEKEPVKKIKNYDKTDLCLLEGFADTPGLGLADLLTRNDRLYTIGHPESHPYVFHKGNAIYSRNFSFAAGVVDDEAARENVQGAISEAGCSYSYMKKVPQVEIMMTPFGPAVMELQMCTVSIRSTTTTIPVWYGSSGSPVVNKYGNVVGVIFAKSPNGFSSEMIHVKHLRDFLGQN